MTAPPRRRDNRSLTIALYGVALMAVLYGGALFGTRALFSIGGPPGAFWDPVVAWMAYMAPQIYVPALAVKLIDLVARRYDRRPLFWIGVSVLAVATLVVGGAAILSIGWRGVLLLFVQLATMAIGMRLFRRACGPMAPPPAAGSSQP